MSNQGGKIYERWEQGLSASDCALFSQVFCRSLNINLSGKDLDKHGEVIGSLGMELLETYFAKMEICSDKDLFNGKPSVSLQDKAIDRAFESFARKMKARGADMEYVMQKIFGKVISSFIESFEEVIGIRPNVMPETALRDYFSVDEGRQV